MAKGLRDFFADLQLSQGQERGGRESGQSEAFVMKVAEMIFTQAVVTRSSDIHIEPSADGARIRFRIDGMLHEVLELAPEVRDPLVRSIKIKANMTNDAIGRSKPQDGRISFQSNGRLVDLRLSSFPTLYGDVLAIRLLDRSATLMKLEDLGFSQTLMHQFTQIILRPNGLFLVTGPGNSGKTTTLYGALNKLRSPQIKVCTLEDPVEYQVPGINQAQINPSNGVTFPTGLRSLLRQDANVILVGEIRDVETAEIAVRAALTGHMVFSTLHTRHSFGAILRLMDMKIEPHLIVGSLNGVVAQRLVRNVCQECKQPDPEAAKAFVHFWKRETGKEPSTIKADLFVKGLGCPACNRTGYKGRVGIFELLVLSEELKRLIIDRDTRSMYKTAISHGMITMSLDGLAKASRGETTVAEVIRVTGETSGEL